MVDKINSVQNLCWLIVASVVFYNVLQQLLVFNKKMDKSSALDDPDLVSGLSQDYLKRIKKEAAQKYHQRRQLVRSACADIVQEKVNISRYRIMFLPRESWTVCLKLKVGSTTTYSHVMSLYPEIVDKYDARSRLHVYEHFKLSRQTEQMLKEVKERSLTMAFTRHPMERLFSMYTFFIVDIDKIRVLKRDTYFRDQVLRFQRESTLTTTIVQPEYFVRYLLLNVTRPYHMHNIIRPQWSSCPFCSMDFDVLGKLETSEEDYGFVFDTLRLRTKINATWITNGRTGDDAKVGGKTNRTVAIRNFLSQISIPSLRAICEFYRLDFIMFNYTFPGEHCIE